MVATSIHTVTREKHDSSLEESPAGLGPGQPITMYVSPIRENQCFLWNPIEKTQKKSEILYFFRWSFSSIDFYLHLTLSHTKACPT